jgi:hypothetical protein
VIIDIVRRLLHVPVPAPPDAVVIDQSVYLEERQRVRVAYMVWEWARDVVRKRTKVPLPPKLPRNDVVRDWMNGLWVQEVFALSNADGFSIMHHIYSDIRLEGVRRVQMLPESTLRFPAPKPEPDFSRPGAGGGPRRK